MMDGESFEDGSWRGQHIEYVPLDLLVLWSENPRDPMGPDADNRQIIENALRGTNAKTVWKLERFAKGMGEEYDCSELPTVVYDEETGKYVVYDGNRRVAIALAKRLNIEGLGPQLPLFPRDVMPCNVCERDVALKHVLRKHGSSGTWSAYHRDVFACKYMGEKPSVLVRLQDLIDAIDEYPDLNQRYVADDILNEKHLRQFGLDPSLSDYGVPEDLLKELVGKIATGVKNGSLGTRAKRNDPAGYLGQHFLDEIRQARSIHKTVGTEQLELPGLDAPYTFLDNSISEEGDSNSLDTLCGECGELGDKLVSNEDEGANLDGNAQSGSAFVPRRTRGTQSKQFPVFGGPLSLKPGNENNIYRTLEEFWLLGESGKLKGGDGYIFVFRLGLRVLVETAAKVCDSKSLSDYLKRYQSDAWEVVKSRPDAKDLRTFMSNAGVGGKCNLEKLLHTGAHNYESSGSRDQALSLSVIVGALLTQSCGK